MLQFGLSSGHAAQLPSLQTGPCVSFTCLHGKQTFRPSIFSVLHFSAHCLAFGSQSNPFGQVVHFFSVASQYGNEKSSLISHGRQYPS